MHGKDITNQTWLKKYNVKQVYRKDKIYKSTLSYLKNQKYLSYSKVFFLLNSFINKNYPICYVLTHRNKIVGFVGTIFSKKKFSDNNYLTCNIHSWLVDRNHRIASKLLFDYIDKKNCLITVLSSLPRLGSTFIRLGFKELIMKYRLTLVKKFFRKKFNSKFEIINNLKKLNKLSEKKVVLSYSNKKYIKFMFQKKNSKRNCLIVGNITYKKKILKTFNIIYCSNRSFLNKNLIQFFELITDTFKVTFCGDFFLKKNESYFNNNNKYSFIKDKKVYMKNIPKKFVFDLLYSETEF